MAADGATDAGAVVVALGGPGFSVATAAACGARAGLREAGASVAQCFERVQERPHRALVVLTDGLARPLPPTSAQRLLGIASSQRRKAARR